MPPGAADAITNILNTGIAIAVLGYMVRYFMQVVERKDTQIERIIHEFRETLDTHASKFSQSIDKLDRSIQEILTVRDGKDGRDGRDLR